MIKPVTFSSDQIVVVNNAVSMAEELVCNFYKMSANQWLRHRYDIKTVKHLASTEITDGSFAQIIRYEGRKKETLLGSSTYDFYKICLQDHAIISALIQSQHLDLLLFTLYIIVHELVHIVRFSQYVVNFNASPAQKQVEEKVVHDITQTILEPIKFDGIKDVLTFHKKWNVPID